MRCNLLLLAFCGQETKGPCTNREFFVRLFLNNSRYPGHEPLPCSAFLPPQATPTHYSPRSILSTVAVILDLQPAFDLFLCVKQQTQRARLSALLTAGCEFVIHSDHDLVVATWPSKAVSYVVLIRDPAFPPGPRNVLGATLLRVKTLEAIDHARQLVEPLSLPRNVVRTALELFTLMSTPVWVPEKEKIKHNRALLMSNCDDEAAQRLCPDLATVFPSMVRFFVAALTGKGQGARATGDKNQAKEAMRLRGFKLQAWGAARKLLDPTLKNTGHASTLVRLQREDNLLETFPLFKDLKSFIDQETFAERSPIKRRLRNLLINL